MLILFLATALFQAGQAGNVANDANCRLADTCNGANNPQCVVIGTGVIVDATSDSAVCNVTAANCKCRVLVADGANCSLAANNCNTSAASRCVVTATNAFVTAAANNDSLCTNANAGNCKCRKPIATGAACTANVDYCSVVTEKCVIEATGAIPTQASQCTSNACKCLAPIAANAACQQPSVPAAGRQCVAGHTCQTNDRLAPCDAGAGANCKCKLPLNASCLLATHANCPNPTTCVSQKTAATSGLTCTALNTPCQCKAKLPLNADCTAGTMAALNQGCETGTACLNVTTGVACAALYGDAAKCKCLLHTYGIVPLTTPLGNIYTAVNAVKGATGDAATVMSLGGVKATIAAQTTALTTALKGATGDAATVVSLTGIHKSLVELDTDLTALTAKTTTVDKKADDLKLQIEALQTTLKKKIDDENQYNVHLFWMTILILLFVFILPIVIPALVKGAEKAGIIGSDSDDSSKESSKSSSD